MESIFCYSVYCQALKWLKIICQPTGRTISFAGNTCQSLVGGYGEF